MGAGCGRGGGGDSGGGGGCLRETNTIRALFKLERQDQGGKEKKEKNASTSRSCSSSRGGRSRRRSRNSGIPRPNKGAGEYGRSAAASYRGALTCSIQLEASYLTASYTLHMYSAYIGEYGLSAGASYRGVAAHERRP